MKIKKIFFILVACFPAIIFSQVANQTQPTAVNPEKALYEFKILAEKIEISPIQEVPVHQNGRIKPLDTMAQEMILYIAGGYKKFGLHPVQTYIALMAFEGSPYIEMIEVRDLNLRTEIGFPKSKRFYSLADIESSPLMQIAEPLFKKQQENPRMLSEHEKKTLEAYQQYSILKEIITGQNLSGSVDYTFLNPAHGTGEQSGNVNLQSALKSYFQTLGSTPAEQISAAHNLIQISRTQTPPELFKHYLDKIQIEVLYNKMRPFLWASIMSILLGICFFTPLFKNKISFEKTRAIYFVTLLSIAFGLGLRVYITKFAPITNMFGTMIWVSFGITLFSFVLFSIYKNYVIPGITLIASGLLLMLTEQIPLILSPDLDPIVAVLRSNFWLSTHVTTITISYAAFTIAMILGNIGLVRLWFVKDNEAYFKEYSHYAYRMIQLGCFLLTVGIILGGIWADYSWGRFWGWDPKETWALIADLGFLAILHSRLTGWITPFSLLAWSPMAYLLVIMAWYGVNFILAAGLHSYGFSSGGATMVAVFVSIQVALLLAGFLKVYKKYGTLNPKMH